MAEIAVIIPAYVRNETDLNWLMEAAQSVFAQSFQDFELFIIDDCSPQPINAAKVDPRLHFVRHDRQRGPGAARNTGARMATAQWLLALDSDDHLKPDALETLYAARCETGVIYGDVEYIGNETGYRRLAEWSIEGLLKLNGLLPVTSLHSRAAWHMVNGWSESLRGLEDLDYWIRLAARGICGKRIDAVTLEYRRHGSSRTAGLLEENNRQFNEAVKVIRQKHATVYGRMAEVACRDCPGGTGPGNGAEALLADGIGAERVEMKYTGMKHGSYTVRSQITGIKYKIGGRGSRFIADARDIAWFLAMAPAGQPEFVVIQPPPAVSQMSAQADIPLAPELSDITSLNVKEALALIDGSHDPLDLRVWHAEEKASDTPRSTVVKAIEKRMKVLEPSA